MRTKALLGLAALAAGALTSMAQSNVYSLNVVGYYNITVPAGQFYLTANQLDNGTNGLNQVLGPGQLGDEVLTFRNNAYNIDITDGTAWQDANTGNPTTTTVSPGQGFFYQNAQGAPETITFVGQVRQGSLNTVYGSGFTLASTPVPVPLSLTSNNFPQVLGMEGLTFANNAYFILINDGGPGAGGIGWQDANTGNPINFAPAIGQGYFIQNPNPGNTNWTLNFTVQ